jgi:hypothetical protein
MPGALPPLIAIGSSTGGPAALLEVLKGLGPLLARAPMRSAIVIVQHGDAEFEHHLRRARRLFVRDGFGTAGQDDAGGFPLADIVVTDVPGMDLAEHTELAHAACDELGVLRPEVEYQNPVGVDIRRPQRQCGPALN